MSGNCVGNEISFQEVRYYIHNISKFSVMQEFAKLWMWFTEKRIVDLKLL